MSNVRLPASHLDVAADEVLSAREVEERADLATEEGEWMQLPVEGAERRAVVRKPGAGAIPGRAGDLAAGDRRRHKAFDPRGRQPHEQDDRKRQDRENRNPDGALHLRRSTRLAVTTPGAPALSTLAVSTLMPF